MPDLHELTDAEIAADARAMLANASKMEDDDEYETDDGAEDEEIDVENETYLDRLLALRDIVPPTTRAAVSNFTETTASYAFTAARWTGYAAWVVVTAGVMLLLPVVLEVEKEQAAMSQAGPGGGMSQQQLTNAAQQMVQPGSA